MKEKLENEAISKMTLRIKGGAIPRITLLNSRLKNI